MEPRARHVLVGIFVLVLAAFGIGLALWMGSAGPERNAPHYRVMFDEPVTGLSVGSPVLYSGIKVGEVVSLSLHEADPRRAIARISLSPSIPVRQDTRARLQIAGIAGNAVIQLSDGGPHVPLMTRHDGEEPLILAPRSALASLVSGEDSSMSTMNGILLRTHELLSEENLALIHGSLVNLEQATASAAGQREEVAALIASLTAASRESTLAVREASGMLRDARGLLNEDGRQILASTREAMASLERGTARMEALLRNNQASLDQGLAATGPTVREFQLALANLNTLLRRMNQDPAGYLLGRESIEEITP